MGIKDCEMRDLLSDETIEAMYSLVKKQKKNYKKKSASKGSKKKENSIKAE